MYLYHYSEDPSIPIFMPRLSSSFPHLPPVVWAIDQAHSVHYLFPRDCPRVIYWKAQGSSEEDEKELFAHTQVDKIIVLENGWLEQIRKTKLYVYTFSMESFTLFEEAKNAGYYISEHEIVPVKVEPVGDLLEKILQNDVDLRFTPNLYPIRNRIITSSLNFSVIRFGNATQLKNS